MKEKSLSRIGEAFAIGLPCEVFEHFIKVKTADALLLIISFCKLFCCFFELCGVFNVVVKMFHFIDKFCFQVLTLIEDNIPYFVDDIKSAPQFCKKHNVDDSNDDNNCFHNFTF